MGKMMEKLLITGGRGFIGRNLAEYLRDRYTVFAPGREELNLLDQEAVLDYVDRNKVTLIVHCANVGGGRDTLDVKGVTYHNLAMFFNLTQTFPAVRKMVHFGSGAEYDIRHYIPRMKEDYLGEHIPVDEYGFSKYVCSKYILASQDPITCLRLFGVFGKYETYHTKFISNAIVKNLLSLPITVKQNVYFDYLYVNDLVRIVEHVLTHDMRHKEYNVTPGKPMDLISLAKMANSVGERESEIRVLIPGLGVEYSGDNRRLSGELGDFSFTPIEQAVRELYDWYKMNVGTIDQKLLEEGDGYIPYSRVSRHE